MTLFKEGDLYIYTEDPKNVFRILDSDSYTTFIIEVNSRRQGVPKEESTLLLKDKLSQGIIEAIPELNQRIIEENVLSDKQIKKRDQRYEVINSFWNNPEERKRFLKKSSRKDLYKEVAQDLKISDRSARSLISQYLVGGMTRNSLLPEYRKRGGSGKERKLYKKEGTDSTGASGRVFVGKKEREQFKESYERKILKEGKNRKEAYNYLIRKYYTRTITDENGIKQTVYIKDTPTERQFYYWISKHRDREKELTGARGENEYNNNYRTNKGSFRETVMGPGSLVEIDAMHCNITVVSKWDRNLIIGRPLLYTAIDVWSGLIMGFYLGIENESWRTTAFTLMNIIEDKVDFCSKYGVEIKREDWPSAELPRLIRADKGALNSPRIREIENAFKVEFTFTPPYSPRYKPNIEHMHKYYQDYFETHLEKYGADLWNSGKRGSRDAREFACLTIEELTEIVIRLTLKYNTTINRDYSLSPLMQAEGVIASPARLWEWGVSEGLASLIKVEDPEVFRLSLLNRDQRIIGKKGIQLNTHYYLPDDLQTARIFNNHPGEKVDVVYNGNDITEVYLKRNGTFHRLRMKDFSEDYRGISVEEDRSLRQHSFFAGQKRKEQEYLDQIDLDEYIDELVKGKDKTIPASKSKRQKRVENIKKNRKEYIKQLKLEENLKREGKEELKVKPAPPQAESSSFDERRRLFIEKAMKELREKEEQGDE